jgi:hypothetical protein
MSALCSREDRRHFWNDLTGWGHLHIDPLAAEQLHTGSPMQPTTPILPEQGSSSDLKRMQQQTDSAWLRRGFPMPLKRHAPAGAPLRMKKDILKGATFWREDDEQCTYASVPLKLCSGAWTNHSVLPPLLQQL